MTAFRRLKAPRCKSPALLLAGCMAGLLVSRRWEVFSGKSLLASKLVFFFGYAAAVPFIFFCHTVSLG